MLNGEMYFFFQYSRYTKLTEEIEETKEKISRVNTDQQKICNEVKKLSLRISESSSIDNVNKYVYGGLYLAVGNKNRI